MPIVSVPVQCPYCHSTAVIKAGKQANGTQRYQCQNGRCARRIFLLQYQDRGRALEIRYCQGNNVLTDKGGYDGTPSYDYV